MRTNEIPNVSIDRLIELVIVNDKHFYKFEKKMTLKEKFFSISILKVINFIKYKTNFMKKKSFICT